MILYHAITNYHILEMMLYKKMFHENEEVILILPDFINKKLPFYKDLEELGFFDKVYEFPYSGNKVEFANDESSIGRTFKEIVGVGIEEFDEIYIACAQYCLTKYVLSENMKFFNIEDGAGSLCQHKYAIEAMTKMNYNLGTWARENEILTGKNKNIIKNICNLSAQKLELEVDNIIDFNVAEVLKHTDLAYIDKIKKFFKAPEKMYVGEKAALILTQHFANIRLMSVEEQIYMYQLVIDFYAENYNIVIKRHPDDWVNYDEDLQNIQHIESLFPFELVPYILSNGKFDIAITVSSASISNIDSLIPKKIYCGIYFIYHYKEMVRVYYILKLLEKNKQKNIVFCNVYEDLVKNLLEYSDANLENNKIIFVNNTEDLELDINSESVFVFGDDISSDIIDKFLDEVDKTNGEVFLVGKNYNSDIVEKFKRFKIEKNKNKEKIIADLDDEYIFGRTNYDYSNLELSKTLAQTGITTKLIVEN